MEGDDGIDVKHCKEILAQRGDNCLEKFCWSITEVEFDHNLLFWHIATDLCYRVDLDHKHEDASQLPLACKISECLSNYMLYLLVVNPTMLPKGIGDIRYKDTCDQATKFFKSLGFSKSTDKRSACQALLRQEIKGDNESQSVLHDGCRLAKELQSLESPNESPESTHNWSKEENWEMISKVWMEILLYVASCCGWKEHGQHLIEGGEFLTHLSLLMAYLGLSEQYTIYPLGFRQP